MLWEGIYHTAFIVLNLLLSKIITLPWYDDDEVHDIPRISEVASFMQDKSICEDFHKHFNGENYHEHRF